MSDWDSDPDDGENGENNATGVTEGEPLLVYGLRVASHRSFRWWGCGRTLYVFVSSTLADTDSSHQPQSQNLTRLPPPSLVNCQSPGMSLTAAQKLVYSPTGVYLVSPRHLGILTTSKAYQLIMPLLASLVVTMLM